MCFCLNKKFLYGLTTESGKQNTIKYNMSLKRDWQKVITKMSEKSKGKDG